MGQTHLMDQQNIFDGSFVWNRSRIELIGKESEFSQFTKRCKAALQSKLSRAEKMGFKRKFWLS